MLEVHNEAVDAFLASSSFYLPPGLDIMYFNQVLADRIYRTNVLHATHLQHLAKHQLLVKFSELESRNDRLPFVGWITAGILKKQKIFGHDEIVASVRVCNAAGMQTDFELEHWAELPDLVAFLKINLAFENFEGA